MAESNAISAFGTLLKRGDGADPEEFTPIAEVQDIRPPSLGADTEEVTHQESPDGWREYIVTLLDGGEVSFDLNFIPTNATHNASSGLLKDYSARQKRNYQVVFPDGTTWEFAALVTNFEADAPVGGKLSASVTLKITGKPTLA